MNYLPVSARFGNVEAFLIAFMGWPFGGGPFRENEAGEEEGGDREGELHFLFFFFKKFFFGGFSDVSWNVCRFYLLKEGFLLFVWFGALK